MKKRFVTICMVVLIMFTGCINRKEAVSTEDLEKYSKIAQTAITAAVEGDYQTFSNMSDDLMRSTIDEEKFAEVTAIVNEKGSIVDFGKADGIYMKNETTNNKNVTIIQNVKCEDGDNTYTISFNENGEMTGFFIK